MTETWTANDEDNSFFIFDRGAMKTEYDILEDAILYYHPKNVSYHYFVPFLLT